MCYFDADPAEVWKVTHPKARKPHSCACCRAVIPRGQQYEREFMVSDGCVDVGVLCECCAVARKVFGRHHSMTPNVGWFRQALRDCFDGAAKDDGETREWRDLYAGILRRERATRVRS